MRCFSHWFIVRALLLQSLLDTTYRQNTTEKKTFNRKVLRRTEKFLFRCRRILNWRGESEEISQQLFQGKLIKQRVVVTCFLLLSSMALANSFSFVVTFMQKYFMLFMSENMNKFDVIFRFGIFRFTVSCCSEIMSLINDGLIIAMR